MVKTIVEHSILLEEMIKTIRTFEGHNSHYSKRIQTFFFRTNIKLIYEPPYINTVTGIEERRKIIERPNANRFIRLVYLKRGIEPLTKGHQDNRPHKSKRISVQTTIMTKTKKENN